MDLRKRNTQIVEKMDKITEDIWKNKKGINEELISCIKEINAVMKEFIGRVEEFRGYGVDIPEDVILSQLRNLMDGFEQRDSILLADSMEYELKNTILFYNDILSELEKEQVTS